MTENLFLTEGAKAPFLLTKSERTFFKKVLDYEKSSFYSAFANDAKAGPGSRKGGWLIKGGDEPPGFRGR